MIVAYADAQPNGLALMVGGLIQANLEAHPERRRLLRPAVVALVAPDAGVSATLTLFPGRVVVSAGGSRRGRPHVVVRADSAALLQLSAVPLRLGLPDPLSPQGRRVLRKVLSRDIRISGLLAHPVIVARVTKLLSVA